ncbi:Bifunctional pinoresinol-lariciresinol reductase [Bienertia sinuspersici]
MRWWQWWLSALGSVATSLIAAFSTPIASAPFATTTMLIRVTSAIRLCVGDASLDFVVVSEEGATRAGSVERILEGGGRGGDRFLPSEFGMDPARMGHAIEPGRYTFDEKMIVRKATEEAQIPYTYIIANCFGGYFVGNLSQMGTLFPPKEKVVLYGDGNVKGTFINSSFFVNYILQILY